jgi:hypothetical protein
MTQKKLNGKETEWIAIGKKELTSRMLVNKKNCQLSSVIIGTTKVEKQTQE